MNTNDEKLLFRDEVFQIVGCAIEILNTLGHGIIEKPYENALGVEFGLRKIPFRSPESFRRVLGKKGLPFREAYQGVGSLVAKCSAKRLALNQISLAEPKKHSPLFDIHIGRVFNVRRSHSRRLAIGAPSPKNVQAQINRWRSDVRRQR